MVYTKNLLNSTIHKMANEPIAETLKTAKKIVKFWYHQLPQQTQMELVELIQQMEQATTIWEVSRLQGQMASKVTPEQKKKLLLMTVKDLPTQYK